MKKMILAVLLLLCFALLVASCTPEKDLPVNTDENGNVVTNQPSGDNGGDNGGNGGNNGNGGNGGNGGGNQIVVDDEEGWGELTPVN